MPSPSPGPPLKWEGPYFNGIYLLKFNVLDSTNTITKRENYATFIQYEQRIFASEILSIVPSSLGPPYLGIWISNCSVRMTGINNSLDTVWILTLPGVNYSPINFINS